MYCSCQQKGCVHCRPTVVGGTGGDVTVQKAKTWKCLSDEISRWALTNYGRPSEPWELFLGVVEEIGEFLEARDDEGRSDSLGDQTIYALNLQRTVGLEEFRNGTLGTSARVNPERMLLAVARCSRCLLKRSQGIRRFDDAMVRSEVGLFLHVWWSWACRQASTYNLPTMLEITNRVWEKVARRNWKQNPDTGVV